MKANEHRTRVRPARAGAIVLGVAALLTGSIVALVCYKTGLQPLELVWFGDRGLSNIVLAILGEARYEILALGGSAANLAWLLVRLHAVETVRTDTDRPLASETSAEGAAEAQPDVILSDITLSDVEPEAPADGGSARALRPAPRGMP